MWEWFILSYPTALSVLVLFVNFFCMCCSCLMQKDRKIVSHVVTVLHAVNVSHGGDLFAQHWPFCMAVTVSHAVVTVLHGCFARDGVRFARSDILLCSPFTLKDGVSVLPLFFFMRNIDSVFYNKCLFRPLSNVPHKKK